MDTMDATIPADRPETLLVSLHPAEKHHYENTFSNILFLKKSKATNIYREIIPYVDLIISDLSSLLHDGINHNIDSAIFFPDIEEYEKLSRGIIPIFKEIIESKNNTNYFDMVNAWLNQDYSHYHLINDQQIFRSVPFSIKKFNEIVDE